MQDSQDGNRPTRAAADSEGRLLRRRRPDPSIAADAGDNRWRDTIRSRALVAAVAVACWSAAIEARLIYLQVIQYDDLTARAERQQHRTIVAPPKRGDIVDRAGHVLAYSVDVDTVWADTTAMAQPANVAAALCGVLEGCGEADRQNLTKEFSRRRPFMYVRRKVAPEQARRIAALNLPGIGIIKEDRRFYPNLELAAHALGFVGLDNKGLHGIEKTYDDAIRGDPGKTLVQTDAKQRGFSRIEKPPTAGASLELTIDQYLQHVAERELHATVVQHRAAGGTALIMDPHTGEILALANEPTFNPNAFTKYDDAIRRNRAIEHLYEPGSTFKIVTASAALEEHVVRLEEPFDVSAGQIQFGRRIVRDVHRYGTLSFTDVIVKSSNVGAIKVGLRLGAERLVRYVNRFGFGRPLSRDFRGESAGIVYPPAALDDSALASVSMGYQVGVTPLQMAAAVSAVANGGELIEPRIVRAVIREGRRTEVARHVIRRAILPETAATLTAIMEQVVERGTAKSAQLAGYTIAGKTGTAAKLINGIYSKVDYNASFVGFIPSRQPVYTVLVMIDSPRGGYYGGSVAAPAFKRIAEAALRRAGIAPAINPVPPVLVVRGEPDPDVPAPLPVRAATDDLPLAAFSPANDAVPELTGLSAREAVRRLARLGLRARLTGDGVVESQQPAAGTPLEHAREISLRLGRQALRPVRFTQ